MRARYSLRSLVLCLALLLFWSPTAQAGPLTTLQSAATATGNGNQLNVAEKAVAGVTVTGTFDGTVTFEGSMDGNTTWSALSCTELTTFAAGSTTTTTGQFACNVSGLTGFRARISTYNSGSITVKAFPTNVAGTNGLKIDDAGNLVVTLGTLLNTEVPATTFRKISAGTTEDKHAVKTSAGTIFSISATNSAATVAYLKCENDTAANTDPASDTPEFSAAIPGATTGAGFHMSFPMGFEFSNAWTCWIVTGKADNDVAEVGANDVHVFYTFK